MQNADFYEKIRTISKINKMTDKAAKKIFIKKNIKETKLKNIKIGK